MLDLDTFLTTWYVLMDDAITATPSRPGLGEREVATLAMAAQWKLFPSKWAVARSALCHLRSAFPGLPDRSQFNRLIRKAHDSLVTVMLRWAQQVGRAQEPMTCLRSGRAVRNHRRSVPGWLDGIAGTGWLNRLGWHDGLHLLTAVTPAGVPTGYAVAPAQTREQPDAEDFLAARAQGGPDSDGRNARDRAVSGC